MAGTVPGKIKNNTADSVEISPFVKAENSAELEIFNASFKEINRLLLQYAAGNFKYRGKISGMLNSVDTVISGINMLGEELQSSTISRDYFTGIFNAVPDMIFVISPKGVIQSINYSAANFFHIPDPENPDLRLSQILELQEKVSFFNLLKKALSGTSSFACEALLKNNNDKKIPVWCLANKINDSRNKFSGYLLVARDITDKKQSENKVLRAIVETQETEQRRVAEDLHDSLGQELSALKLYLITMQNHLAPENGQARYTLQKSISLLDNSITNLREICFNLLPGVIQLSGLCDAIQTLADNLNDQKAIKVKFIQPKINKELKKNIEVALYRITQEFINNSLKHSGATAITIRLAYTDKIELFLSDNGRGFEKTKSVESGNGIKNMRSRVNAFNGEFTLSSSPANGTIVIIEIPFSDEYEQ